MSKVKGLVDTLLNNEMFEEADEMTLAVKHLSDICKGVENRTKMELISRLSHRDYDRINECAEVLEKCKVLDGELAEILSDEKFRNQNINDRVYHPIFTSWSSQVEDTLRVKNMNDINNMAGMKADMKAGEYA